jgi:tRNA modification GTPase
MNDLSDTIAAIATAPGEAGISIVRVSGPKSLEIADRIFRGKRMPSSLAEYSFVHGHIRSISSDGHGDERDVDEVILLVYRAPHSYTREDVVEIQGHGGRTSAKRILRSVLDAGARLADPGEFTKRAFLNGRIDLLQAEAVADLIMAQSDRAAACAIEQLEGCLSSRISGIYEDMMSVAADVEATLDFAEDELPPSTMRAITDRFRQAIGRMREVLATWEEGHLLREGALVVIAGKPNVGKSTLLNTLLGKARAIVTEIPGTTRDTIEEQLVMDGVPIRLVDTAGLREATCKVEKEGIERAEESLEKADVVIYMIDGSQDTDQEDVTRVSVLTADRCLVVLNKTDLGQRVKADAFVGFSVVSCSLIEGYGVDELRSLLLSKVGHYIHGAPHAAISERHRMAIQNATDKANESLSLLEHGQEDMTPVAAGLLRSALEDLGSVTGKTYSNELLDNIFRKFCLGK